MDEDGDRDTSIGGEADREWLGKARARTQENIARDRAARMDKLLGDPTRVTPILPTLPRQGDMTLVKVMDYGLVPGDKVMHYAVLVIDAFTNKEGECEMLTNEREAQLLAVAVNHALPFLVRRSDVTWRE